MRAKCRVRELLSVALLVAGVVSSAGIAIATDGNLPGGTSISVDITAPPNNALKAFPPGRVDLQGTAAVGTGVPVPSTLIVYVLDVSFSTIRGDGGAGCGGDQNGDGISDTILDCEIAAAKALNALAVSTGTVGRVGVAVFGGRNAFDPTDTGGAAADVGPAGGDQLFTGPATDANSAGGPDVEQVLSSAFSTDMPVDGGVTVFSLKSVGANATNFAAGLSAAASIVTASDASPASPAITSRVIVFMSDGLANTGPTVASVAVPAGVIIKAFAVGSISNCGSDPNGLGSLDDVAAKGAAGSDCTHVATVADLPGVVPGIVASKLTSLDLSVDGGPAIDIRSEATPPIPAAGLTGPVSVTYEHTVGPGLAPGIHTLCVTADGSDGGGTGAVTECINVTVATIDLTPATADNELGTPGQTHTVTATVAAGAAGGVPGVTVDFDILAGPNTGNTASAPTDGSGQATFTYAATQGLGGLGTDTIEGCFTDQQNDELCDSAQKHWRDTTPPQVSCVETTNPHGLKVPPAGSTTLPGSKGGQNEDGFYLVRAVDAVDPDPQIFVQGTSGNPTPPFGPYSSGTKLKITEAPGATPSSKPMGSSTGQAGAIAAHITLDSDAVVTAVDFSGNAASVTCFVPPPPK